MKTIKVTLKGSPDESGACVSGKVLELRGNHYYIDGEKVPSYWSYVFDLAILGLIRSWMPRHWDLSNQIEGYLDVYVDTKGLRDFVRAVRKEWELVK